MVATLANNGYYHQAHVVKYWQNPGVGSAEQTPKVQSRSVLTAQQAGDVQYAMEATTFNGGTAYPSVTYGLNSPGMVISKTGTATNSVSGFFIGATTQYALAVGMFTVNPSKVATENLSMLGGLGFGGYWPAKIWNAFANAEFAQSPQLFSTSPNTQGQQAWNLLGTVPKAKKKATCTETFNGQQVSIVTKGCPTPKSTSDCTMDSKGNYVCANGNGNNATPTSTATATCQYQGDPTCASGQQPGCTYDSSDGQYDICNGATATPTATSTCSYDSSDGQYDICNGTNGGSGQSVSASTVSGSQAGLAVGGGLMILPGSLLWTTMSRRRRRKRRAGAAE
jgi:membrane peptidoglycan carboxypeptidase